MGHHYPRSGTDSRHLAKQDAARLSIPPRSDALDLDQLRQENEQLRTLVVELSRIVARNVLDQK